MACKIPSCIWAFFAASNLLAITPPAGALACDQAAPVTISADKTVVPIINRDWCSPASGANAIRNLLVAGKLGATNLRNAKVASIPAIATVAAMGSSATRGDKKSKKAANGAPSPAALLPTSSHFPHVDVCLPAGVGCVASVASSATAGDTVGAAASFAQPQALQNLSTICMLTPQPVQN